MESAVPDFIAYAENLARAIALELRGLRGKINNGAARREALACIFQQTHSLKGLAQAAGQDAAAHLAHELESALDALRLGQSALDETALNALEQSVAAIARSLGGDAPTAVGSPALTVSRPALPSLILPAELAESLDDYACQRLREALSEGLRVRVVTISLDLASFDTSLRALAANLQGELIATQPLGVEQDTGKLRFRLVIATATDAKTLAAQLESYGPFTSKPVTPPAPARIMLEMLAHAGQLAARASGKEIAFGIEGGATLLTGELRETLFAALLHLVRNAVGHGSETPSARLAAGKNAKASVVLAAHEDNGQAIFRVTDDGRGICPDALAKESQQQGFDNDGGQPFEILFRSGFTTQTGVSTLAGRGIGLDIVRQTAVSLGGRVEVTSEIGRGTTFTLAIPLKTAPNR